jgi:hypothetical protein
MARHDFWIPTYVRMTKRLKNNTYDTKPPSAEGGRVSFPLTEARFFVVLYL